MISLKEYLKVNAETQKYRLPISFLESLKLIFLKTVLENLPFKNKIFIDSSVGSLYWEIIYAYFLKHFEVNIRSGYKYFENEPLIWQANIWHQDKEIRTRGHGNSSANEEVAVSKAIGEYLERRSASFLDEESKKLQKEMTAEEISKTTKIVSDFHAFSEEQKKVNKILGLKSDTKIKVLPVEDLLTKKPVNYPAQSIFLNPLFYAQDEGLIAEITTSGCGGGFDIEMATLSAFYEAVERDSFFCHWLTKNIPSKILLEENIVPEYDKLKKYLEKNNFEVYLLDITTDINVPSVSCVVINKNNNGVCVCAGADLSYRKAIGKAISEMYSCLVFFNSETPYKINQAGYKPFQDTNLSRDERLNFWYHGEYFDHFKFFLTGGTVDYKNLYDSRFFTSKKEELEYLLNKFKNLGNGYDNVYRYSFKKKYLDDLGYKVVRVIVPKLYQLYLTEGYALTESKRLKEFSFFKKGKEDFQINIYPHPFP